MSTLLSIPLPCKLEHLVGEQTLPLGGAGPLALIAPPPAPGPASSTSIDGSVSGDKGSASDATTTTKADEVIVVLKVAELAFPLCQTPIGGALDNDIMIQRRLSVSAGAPHIGSLLAWFMGTPFGTTKNPYSYLFKPSLQAGAEADTASSATGWIRLTLPSTTAEAFPQSNSQDTNPTDKSEPVNEENQSLFLKLRDSFEQALVELGLLTDSMVLSAADDIGQSTRASLGGIAQSIDEITRVRIEGSEAVKPGEEVQLGERTRNFVGGVEGASQGVRDVSNKLTEYIQQGSVWLGGQVGKSIPVGRKGEMEMEEGAEGRPDLSAWEKTKTAVGSIAGGVADGSTTLASHTSQAAQDAVTYSKGSDAGEVVEKASQTAANIGGTASDVVVKTSVALLGGMAVNAAVEADRSGGGDGGGDEQGEEEVRRA